MSADRPPLWRLMHDAFTDHYRQDAYWPGYAAEIRAIASWIEQRQVEDYGGPLPDVREVIEWLTAEADQAERGDQSTSENV